MINYSIPLLRVPNRFRNPLLLFNYMLTCFPYNIMFSIHGHKQHGHEGKWKAKPKQTRQLSELVLVLTLQHVAARLSQVFLLARFCTPPEVKFHVFRQLKRGEEKSKSFLSELHVDSIKQTKKICHIHFNVKVTSEARFSIFLFLKNCFNLYHVKCLRFR